jgi:hypothetical protein
MTVPYSYAGRVVLRIEARRRAARSRTAASPHIDVLACHCSPDGDRDGNPGRRNRPATALRYAL